MPLLDVRSKFLALGLFLLWGLCACQNGSTQPPAVTSTLFYIPPTSAPVAQATIAVDDQPSILVTATSGICMNNLSFIRDVTVPDGTLVAPSAAIHKEWQVQNSGTCHWHDQYTLVFISGDALPGVDAIALYPAKAGATAILELNLIAPETPGTYFSEWQAVDPAGVNFGDTVYLLFSVTAEAQP